MQAAAQALGIDFAELWGEAGELAPDRVTRLAQLESAVRRVREILDEIEPAPEPDIGGARRMHPSVTYDVAGGNVTERKVAERSALKPRRKGKGA